MAVNDPRPDRWAAYLPLQARLDSLAPRAESKPSCTHLDARRGIDGTATITENLLVHLGSLSARSLDAQDAVTFDDPDGWHLVLVPGPGL